jgi:hypothetical protein
MGIIIIKPSYYLTPWVLYTAQVLNRFSIRKRDFGRVARGLIRADDVSVYNTQLPFYILYPPPHTLVQAASDMFFRGPNSQPLKREKGRRRRKCGAGQGV